MKYLLFATIIMLGTNLQAQDFYDLNTIQTIEITFAQSNWDQLMDDEKSGDGNYIMAESVTINGTLLDSVGVKYKGNSTYNANQTKNPLHIELDTYKEHEYDSYTDIKLSNVAKDPSFLREVLSYQILRQYMHAPLSNYANVYINGDLIGLYSNSESVSKKFVNSRFYSKTNTFVKCNPPDGAGPQSDDFPNLVYLGTDSANYYDAYEMKSDDGWDELIELCDDLANDTDNIEDILDVDRAIWMLAFNNVMVNLDSYIGAFAQNYYLYRDDNGRFNSVVWDLNESFGRFSMTGSGNLNSTIAKQQMDPFLHLNESDFPLIQKLLNVPMYQRMYIAHCKTILLENFDNGSYLTTGQTLQNTIDAAVQADDNKFYTYNNFLDNLTTDVGGGGGPGGGTTIGISVLMNGRSTYLLGLSDFTATAPTISNITPSNSEPVIGEPINLTATIDNAEDAYLGFRIDFKAPFTKVEMYDDGAHGDGAANDGVYGTALTVSNSYTQYYIYAENADAGKFSPVRAEHEYYTLTATTTNPGVGDIVINEFMASNGTTEADQDGEYDDWIELYNNSDAAIDIGGYFLSDDEDDLLKWQFPSGTTIQADGYLVVWADNDTDQQGLHANFKLSSAFESIFLLNTAGTIVDEVTYVDQSTDISYGRFPNGIGSFEIMNPTFNAENSSITDTDNPVTELTTLKAIPNPTNASFYLAVNGWEQGERDVLVYNLNGKVMYQERVAKNVMIDSSNWAAGMYVVKVGEAYTKVVIR